MEYFKDSKDNVFAYEDSDVEHDSVIRAQITELQQEGGHDDLIAELRDRLRISDELTQITESEKEELLKPSNEQLAIQHAKLEHDWVKSELDAVTIELMYHWTGDNRASYTEQAWKDYAIALRDYTSTDDDGNPVIVGKSRPSINDYV